MAWSVLRPRGCERTDLLADSSGFGEVGAVRSRLLGFHAQRAPAPSAASGFTKREADRLGVVANFAPQEGEVGPASALSRA